MTDEIVLINAFEVPAGDADAFIAAWEKARDYLGTQPGYVDTVLHRAVTPEAPSRPAAAWAPWSTRSR